MQSLVDVPDLVPKMIHEQPHNLQCHIKIKTCIPLCNFMAVLPKQPLSVCDCSDWAYNLFVCYSVLWVTVSVILFLSISINRAHAVFTNKCEFTHHEFCLSMQMVVKYYSWLWRSFLKSSGFHGYLDLGLENYNCYNVGVWSLRWNHFKWEMVERKNIPMFMTDNLC